MKLKPAGLLFIAAAVVLSLHLGTRGLTEPDEGRCASIARAMVESGDWITPRLYDRAHFNKPPLLYWSMAATFRVAGINEWTARATAAAAAFATLLLTFSLARRLYGEPAAHAAALVLLSSPLFYAMSRIIDPNMLLTFFITAALWAAVSWFHEDRHRYLVVFYVALACSFLTKGPIGMIIVGLALLGYRIGKKPEWPWCNPWNLPLALLCAALSLSWYLAVGMKHPGLFDFFIRQELIARFFTNEHHRSEPFFFYLLILPAAVLPWFPFVLRAAMGPFQRFRTGASARLLTCWVILPTVLFSLSASKMPTYILPLLPALALAAGAQITRDDRWQGKIRPYLPALALGILVPVALLAYGFRTEGWSCRFEPSDIVRAGLFAAVAGLVIVTRKPLARTAATAAMLLISYQACEAFVARHEALLGPQTTTRQIAGILTSEVVPSDRIILYDRHPRGLDFYLEHPVTIPSFKFELQLPTDRERLGNLVYDDSQDVMNWFDSTQRVYVVTSEFGRNDILKRTRTPHRVIYQDNRFVLVCNREPHVRP